MLGRQDVSRYHSACATARNFFCHYDGPLLSRAGTAFVGFSKQTGRSVPPRLIGFQFSNNQGLSLEFGNYYMRAISAGNFVTETPVSVTNVSHANPAVMTIAANSLNSVSANNGAVSANYKTGDSITLAGGTFSAAAVLAVQSTTLTSIAVDNAGGGYVYNSRYYSPGDTITLGCAGTFSTAAQLTVATTEVISAAQSSNGSGGTPGTATVTGTTGTGTKFQANVTIGGGGSITSVNSISLGGAYTANPTFSSRSGGGYYEPVTGGSLSGAVLFLIMGVGTVSILNGGSFTTNAVGGTFTQSGTSGQGLGATFKTALFGPNALGITTPGVYSVVPSSPASQGSTTGTGAGATFNVGFAAASYNTGDWAYLSGIGGMTELNGETFVLTKLTSTTYSLHDVYGNSINTTAFTAYTSGGTSARIYTLPTIYSENDLPSMKFVQSADTMSLCCVNQATGTEYDAQDLIRISDTNWTFSPVIPAPSVTPPANASGSASAAGNNTSGWATYQYVVTSIDPVDGTESIASSIATVSNAVNMAATAGSITVSWAAVSGVNEYYVYKALPAYGAATGVAPPPAGSLFGFAGQAYGASFIDSNIVADFAQTPPTHQNPFAPGQILDVVFTAGGTGFTQAGVAYAVTSATGSGFVGVPVVVGGAIVAMIIDDNGGNYQNGDTIAFSQSGGSGATATLTVGPESGVNPSTVGYFQERRGYANSINNPDTYWFSKPGAFTNFDVRNPTIASDAITGSPWAVQVNGVQWLIQTSGGLLVMTGLRAWLLVGAGSFATNVQSISPSTQNDVPQAFSGCSPIIEPLVINYDVLYVDPNGVYYYDLPYQLYALSEPIDLTDISTHLFTGHSVVANAYCEKPYRLIWSVRDDGALLSLTYYKTQKVQGWARHDTNGLFVSTCSVLEPPVNAAYFATQRFPGGNNAYMIERMDDRIWPDVESVWAVDCGLAYPQPNPAANLTISSATGLGSLTGATGIVGGAGYSAAAYGVVTDQFGGPGAGAVPTLTFVAGALTAVAFSGGNQGSGYTQPLLEIIDPAGSAGGSGASARPILNNATTLTASASVFSAGSVGSVVRAAGGIAAITAYTSGTSVTANVLSPFTQTIPNSGGVVPTISSGSWTMTAPVTVVTGLGHLIGATVTGLADGNVIPPTVVAADGSITLGTAASAITVGLGFQDQFQDVPIDAGDGPTVQGQRKKLAATSLRIEASLGMKVGTNQIDGSSLSPPQLAVQWNGLATPPMSGAGAPNFPPVPYNALATPLRTGDIRVALQGGVATPGQLCVQQDAPLPCNIVAIFSEVWIGDSVQTNAPKPQGRGK